MAILPRDDAMTKVEKKRGPGRPRLYAETKLMQFRVPVEVATLIESAISTIKGLEQAM